MKKRSRVEGRKGQLIARPVGTSRNVELQLQRKITWLLRLLTIKGEHDPFSSRPLLSLTCSLFARPRPGALLRLPG